MKTNYHLNILNDNRENQTLLRKLPGWSENKRARVVQDYKDMSGMYPPFTTFSNFIAKETKLATDPNTSTYAVKDTDI